MCSGPTASSPCDGMEVVELPTPQRLFGLGWCHGATPRRDPMAGGVWIYAERIGTLRRHSTSADGGSRESPSSAAVSPSEPGAPLTNHHTSEIAPAEAAAQVDVAEAPLRSTSPAWVPTLTGGPARTVGAATRQSCVPSFDLPSMTAERLAAFSPFYIEALVVQWPDAGPPVALTGTEAADLPALTSVDGSPRLADSAARASGDSVWILSAADPDGLEFGIEENIARHADLVALVDQEAEGPAASAEVGS